MDENTVASQALLEPPPENWRRPPGRPRTTWMKNIHDDLSSTDLGIHEARDLARYLQTDVFAQRYALAAVHATVGWEVRRQGASHTRTDSRETSVAETAACRWNDADPLSCGPKPRMTSVGNKLDARSQICQQCQSSAVTLYRSGAISAGDFITKFNAMYVNEKPFLIGQHSVKL